MQAVNCHTPAGALQATGSPTRKLGKLGQCARATGTQRTQCPKAFNADQLAIRTLDVLQTRAAGTP